MFINRNRLVTPFEPGETPQEVDDGLLLTQYLRARDQRAFEILVQRHGAMILGTCQRILHNRSDAEDCFQAVFLVLIQKASGLTSRKTIGDWLYGVAYHTALKARYLAVKRKKKESSVDPPKNDPAQVDGLKEVLDQELVRLPAKFREAIVLCDLDNLPRKEVASRLGIPEGTLSSRLTTARKMLGERLSKKGIVLSGMALATLGAAVPSHLMAQAAQNAKVFTGEAVGSISSSVLEKAQWQAGTWSLPSLSVIGPYLIAAVLALSLGANLFFLATGRKSGKDADPDPTLFEWTSRSLDLANDRFSHYGMGKGRAITIRENEVFLDFSSEAGTGHMGLWGKQEMSGDFAIQAQYEILKAPEQVTSGYGASLGILVEMGKPWGAVNAQRGIYPTLGEQLGAGRHIPGEEETQYTRETIPFTGKKGQLIIRKKGEMVIVMGGDPEPAKPREIKRFYCPTNRTRGMALYADPGNAGKAFQCRIFGVQWEGNVPRESLN